MADPDYFKKQSSMQLCMDLLSSPSYNVNRSARIEELSRRGENCAQYTGAAAVQADRDRQAAEAIRAMQPPPRPAPPAPVTCRWIGSNWVCQ
jgi:hypothetical protein